MTRVNPQRRLRRTVSAVAIALSAALALSACSDDSEPSADSSSSAGDKPSPSKTSTAQGATLAKQWPLLGTRADGEVPKRQALAVKIENTGNSRPQIGLGKADLVVQQLVEGGVTRLAAFYHSRIPREVGPVRSMRTSDVGIVAPADALLVASGGAPPTVKRVRNAKIPTATEGAPGYHRVGNRRAPYNLFMHLDQLAKARARGGPTPAPYVNWADPDARVGKGKPAGTINARFSGGTVNTWTYRPKSKHYTRSINHTGGRDDFRPSNVLALKVRVTDAGYPDPAGNPVPETVLEGKGEATLFHQGKAFPARWHKRGPQAQLRLTDRGGKPLPVPPGRTWIELVPGGQGDVQYRR
jgi:hypothetical protein